MSVRTGHTKEDLLVNAGFRLVLSEFGDPVWERPGRAGCRISLCDETGETLPYSLHEPALVIVAAGGDGFFSVRAPSLMDALAALADGRIPDHADPDRETFAEFHDLAPRRSRPVPVHLLAITRPPS